MTAPENPPAASRFTPEQIERNREFLKQLRANKRKATSEMRDHMGGRCCLCVAYDAAQMMGARLPDCPIETDGEFPPTEISEFYGWPDKDPVIRWGGEESEAHRFNDGYKASKLTHAQIADAFEETWPELKADALLAARKEGQS